MTSTIEKKPTPTTQLSNEPRKAKRVLHSIIKNVVWSVATLVVSLLVLEVAFRACGIGGEEYLKMDPVVGFTHMENKPIIMRSEGWSYDSTNSVGIRDYAFPIKAAPNVHRVAFLGDSKTESLQVPIKDNFAKVIERRLNEEIKLDDEKGIANAEKLGNSQKPENAQKPEDSQKTEDGSRPKIECINFGMSGYGTSQEVLQFMRDVRQYKPEVTVLVYHVLDNDENTAPMSQDTPLPRPYFSLTEQNVLKPDWIFLDAWFCSERAVYFRTFDWLRRHSYVLGVLSQMNKSLSGDKTYDFYSKRILMPALDYASRFPWARYKTDDAVIAERSRLAKEFEQPVKNAGSTVEEQIPDRSSPGFMQKEYNVWLLNHRLQFRVTAALIRKLNEVCKENGSKLIVAALPAPTSSIFYIREMQALEQIAKEENFEFVNVHNKFPQTGGGESSPLFVGFHFSRQGHQLVADILEPAVKRNLAVSSELPGSKVKEADRN